MIFRVLVPLLVSSDAFDIVLDALCKPQAQYRECIVRKGLEPGHSLKGDEIPPTMRHRGVWRRAESP